MSDVQHRHIYKKGGITCAGPHPPFTRKNGTPVRLSIQNGRVPTGRFLMLFTAGRCDALFQSNSLDGTSKMGLSSNLFSLSSLTYIKSTRVVVEKGDERVVHSLCEPLFRHLFIDSSKILDPFSTSQGDILSSPQDGWGPTATRVRIIHQLPLPHNPR